MRHKVSLQIIAGTLDGEAFAFEEHDTLIFGRAPDCHACLPYDTFVSRHHCILEVNPPQTDSGWRSVDSLRVTFK